MLCCNSFCYKGELNGWVCQNLLFQRISGNIILIYSSCAKTKRHQFPFFTSWRELQGSNYENYEHSDRQSSEAKKPKAATPEWCLRVVMATKGKRMGILVDFTNTHIYSHINKYITIDWKRLGVLHTKGDFGCSDYEGSRTWEWLVLSCFVAIHELKWGFVSIS